MGFSIVIASAISLIGLLIFASLIATIALPTVNAIAQLSQKIIAYSSDYGTRIELTFNSANDARVRFYLRNLGPRVIFFRGDGYDWNTIIISYRSYCWRTYILNDYMIMEKKISGTNYTITPLGIAHLNPGEEVLIEAYLPPDAPAIPANETIIVVFVSHYGSRAITRGVRT